jgi:hypothetical protein
MPEDLEGIVTPQSLPPRSPSMASYLGDSTVTTCMRAGLYQTKKGFPVFFGSLRSRNSTTLVELSSSTVLERSSVSGTFSFLRTVGGFAPEHGARRRQASGGVLGSTAPDTSATPGIGVFLQGGATPWTFRFWLMSGKLTCCMASR